MRNSNRLKDKCKMIDSENNGARSMGRLDSLDALRGADMFFIMGGSALLARLSVLAGFGVDNAFAQQFDHVLWHGFHFQDMIFPLFLFIAGVSFPFSCAKQIERGFGRGTIFIRCARRAAMLFLLGLVYSGLLRFDFSELVWGSVLGRIGIAWFGASVLYLFFGWRTRIAIAVSVLLGYWAVMRFVQAPDIMDVSVPANLAEYAQDPISPAGNISGYLDRMLLPGKLTVPGVFSNQGTLSTLPAVVTAMIGMFAGEYLRGRGSLLSGGVRTFRMLAAATGLLLAGLFVAFGCGSWSMPLNKILWSSSFTLVVGGISVALLSVFHYVIDVKGCRNWCFFFRVIGLNSITVYMLQKVVPVASTAKFFFGGLSSFFPPAVSSVVIQLGYITICWLVLWFLHRNKIYWKV